MKIRDISNHDSVAAQDLTQYDGVIIKATEGVGCIDPLLGTNVEAARASGIYHYLSFRTPMADQIAAFKEQMDKYVGQNIRPCLDIEIDSNINQVVPDDIVDRIQTFCKAFTGCVAYADRSFLQQYTAAFAGLDVWQAEYDVSTPTDIESIHRIGWQYQGTPCDLSQFDESILIVPVAVQPMPAAPVDNGSRPAPVFPLPDGCYFGPEGGGANSISGYYSHREDLRMYQQRMADRGWPITVDGLYGEEGQTIPKGNTADITGDFQTEKGLKVDKLIGPNTWAAAWTAPIT